MFFRPPPLFLIKLENSSVISDLPGNTYYFFLVYFVLLNSEMAIPFKLVVKIAIAVDPTLAV